MCVAKQMADSMCQDDLCEKEGKLSVNKKHQTIHEQENSGRKGCQARLQRWQCTEDTQSGRRGCADHVMLEPSPEIKELNDFC